MGLANESANGNGAGVAVVDVPELTADASVELLVRSALGRSVAQLQRHEPGVRRGDDPEDVHKFRVATRRLRSDLRTFGPLLERRWRRGLRTELKWLGGEIGAVRDADVLLARLGPQVRALPGSLADEAGPLLARLGPQVRALPGSLADEAGPLLVRLEGERTVAHAGLLDALGTSRYEQVVGALVDAVAQPQLVAAPGGAPPDERPAGSVVADLVRRPWRELDKDVEALGDEPHDHELHEVRILAKRCRYAAEAVAPVAGDAARLLASAVADVQTVLGDHQDTVVAETWLLTAGDQLPGTRAAVDALVGRQRSERHALRLAWPAAWHAAAAPDLHAWLARA